MSRQKWRIFEEKHGLKGRTMEVEPFRHLFQQKIEKNVKIIVAGITAPDTFLSNKEVHGGPTDPKAHLDPGNLGVTDSHRVSPALVKYNPA